MRRDGIDPAGLRLFLDDMRVLLRARRDVEGAASACRRDGGGIGWRSPGRDVAGRLSHGPPP
jgi:hypothetical protein